MKIFSPVAMFLAAAIPWSPGRSAAADLPATTIDYTVSAADHESRVLEAAYSTGQAGHKLKWLPTAARSTGQASRPPFRAQAARYDAPTAVVGTSERKVDPFSDPFGDAGSVSTSAEDVPHQGLNDNLLESQPSASTLARRGFVIPDDDEPPKAELLPRTEGVRDLEDTEEIMAFEMQKAAIECLDPNDIPSLNELDLTIAPRFPLPTRCKIETGAFQGRNWVPTTFMWKASGLCHKPAYFEQVHLERYGHATGPYTQPLVSAAHFFLTVPVLPYKMGLYPPGECMYTLGYYRPGSCAPYLLDPLPLSIRAGLAQAGAVVGLAAIIP